MMKAQLPSIFTSMTITVIVLTAVIYPLSSEASNGALRLKIKDAETGKAVPVRIEIQGAEGAYYVAADALKIGADCEMSEPGSGPIDQAASLPSFMGRDRITNPYTKTPQFYSVGTSTVALPAGKANIKVFRGPEYKVATASIDIPNGGTVQHEMKLNRWVNMPEKGWYSADDHLHIARPNPEINPQVSQLMQAKDIHVANLVQMGKVGNFAIAQPYAHGPDSYYQDGNYILAAGQENPRTHFLGHTITLGATKAHYNPEKYLIYRLIWQETTAEGAINGFELPFSQMVPSFHRSMEWRWSHRMICCISLRCCNSTEVTTTVGTICWPWDFESLRPLGPITPAAANDCPGTNAFTRRSAGR